jgi:uncharacterized protein YutE (UPF0331/DUF86 family)
MKNKVKLLPSLERNILKYRSLQMSLILFYIEDLKRFVVQSIQATDEVLGTDRLPDGKKLYERAWQFVVDEGILTAEESAEIQELIDYRNDIAHKFHLMTFDLSPENFARERKSVQGVRYDYEAVDRVKEIRDKVFLGFQAKFVMRAGLDAALFADQEHSINYELDLLACRIDKQFELRAAKIGM